MSKIKKRFVKGIKDLATNKKFWGKFFKFYEDCEELKQ
jgi:hypothetical protein